MHPLRYLDADGSLLLAVFLSLVTPLSADAKPNQMRPLERHVGSLTVTVDPRMELLAVVQSLADYRGFDGQPVLTRLSFPYRQEVATRFGSYRNHPAVARFTAMSKRGFWYGHPPKALLFCSQPPALILETPADSLTVAMAGGADSLAAFLDDLRQFVEDTDFAAFFTAQEPFYNQLLDRYCSRIGRDYIADLESFYGVHQRSYSIVLVPLFHPGGFGPRIERIPGVADVYNLSGPFSVEDEGLSFGADNELRRIVWHEFGHSFVNPLTESRHTSLLPACTVLLAEKRAALSPEEAAYWPSMADEWVSEHVIRAITTRFAYRFLGKTAGDEALARENAQGFPHVQSLMTIIERYEANRTRWTTFADFYPEIVAEFTRLAADASH